MSYLLIFATLYSLLITIVLLNNCRKIVKFRIDNKHWHIDDLDGIKLDDRAVLAFYVFFTWIFGFLAGFFYSEM